MVRLTGVVARPSWQATGTDAALLSYRPRVSLDSIAFRIIGLSTTYRALRLRRRFWRPVHRLLSPVDEWGCTDTDPARSDSSFVAAGVPRELTAAER